MIKMKIDIYSKLFNDKILNNMIWKCFYNFSGCVVTNVTWATHKNYTFILFSYFDNPGPAVIYIYIYTYNIIYIYIQSKGQGEPHSEVGSLCSAMCLVRFEPGTFRFWLQCLNLLGTVWIRVSYPSPLKNTTPFFFAKPPPPLKSGNYPSPPRPFRQFPLIRDLSEHFWCLVDKNKKLNLLLVFSNSIFIKFYFEAYWCWTYIQYKSVY